MKKIIIVLLFAALGVVTAFAQVHPDRARYKINGNFSYEIKDTNVYYKLTNVVPSGLRVQKKEDGQFRDLTTADILRGHQVGGDQEVGFRFEKIVPMEGDNQFPGFDELFRNISYWYYDPDIDDWQKDTEIKQSKFEQVDSKDVTVMLIIDCSSSLSSFLETVQNATLNFLERLYVSDPSGHVHVGIVAFSSMPNTKVFPLKSLNNSNYPLMKSFIRSLTPSNGTALFYAWDKAVKQTDDYIRNGNMKRYEKSYFITFTDGIDQTSQDLKHRPTPIVSSDQYYDYIIETTKLTNWDYESDVVFVKGSDIANEAQQAKFETKLSNLSVPNDGEHYERLESFDNLEEKFNEIASRLTNSWKVLNCYVAPARHGDVCWTFGGEIERPKPKPLPKKPKQTRTGEKFVGISGSLGVLSLNSSYMYGSTIATILGLSLGVDCAWNLSEKFSIGFYSTIGAGPSFVRAAGPWGYYSGVSGALDLKIGALMLFGDINNRPFMLGITPCTGFGLDFGGVGFYLPLEVKFGRLLNNHFYLSGYLQSGICVSIPGGGVGAGLNFGYRF